jgi:hypothetical protein
MSPGPNDRIRAASSQISSALGDGTVVLHLTAGMYYGLDHVGSAVWELLQAPRTMAELRDAVLERYDVAPERCEADLRKLLDDLDQAGLVEVCDGTR